MLGYEPLNVEIGCEPSRPWIPGDWPWVRYDLTHVHLQGLGMRPSPGHRHSLQTAPLECNAFNHGLGLSREPDIRHTLGPAGSSQTQTGSSSLCR